MNQKRQDGNYAETLVCNHLIKQGFQICRQNYLKQFGEIDIVAIKKELIVFVEVKMRKNPSFDLSYLITESKQRKISLAAKAYITEHKVHDKICRFDAALVTSKDNNWQINYIENAFQCE